MLLFLLLAVTLAQGQLTPADVQNVTGSVDENGVCLCTVILPDNTFPVHRVEYLEVLSYNLTISVQQEITKIQSYQQTLNIYLQKITNLTVRLEAMEGSSYTELDFELLKLEVKEMETLILQLNVSMEGTNVIVHILFQEIRNISLIVNRLEAYDKNNVLAVRREIVALRKRLEDCEKNQTKPIPPPNYGTCDHGGLLSVGKPYTVQLNWKGFSYKYGAWGKDSLLNTSKEHQYWVAPLDTDGRVVKMFRVYPTLDDLLLYKKPTDKQLTKYSGQGGGMIMYNNTLYFNRYSTGEICTHNVQSSVEQCKALPNAVFNSRFSYAGVSYQDIDFAADESGLWVIYATEDTVGNIVIGKLNPTSLTLEKSWVTTLYKPSASNAFMICGVMYATRSVTTRIEEIFYMYDTNIGQEGTLSIGVDKMMETVQSLSYNPNDHKLYMYNDGYEVTYEVNFKSDSVKN